MAEDFQSRAAEMMKKVLTVGVGALFLTEESLRALVSDFKLPKELLSAVLDSANKTKAEFLNSLSKELMAKIAEKVEVAELIDELFRKNELELHIKINLKPKKSSS